MAVMSITQAMHVIKRELDNVPALGLREFLDELCSTYRNITVKFIYDEESATYHDFFSEAGAREAIANFFADRHGSECVLMIEGQEDELVKALRM
jgi:hypothetical protein